MSTKTEIFFIAKAFGAVPFNDFKCIVHGVPTCRYNKRCVIKMFCFVINLGFLSRLNKGQNRFLAFVCLPTDLFLVINYVFFIVLTKKETQYN